MPRRASEGPSDAAFARRIRARLRALRRGMPDLLEFARHPLYLGLSLFPRQALLLQLLGGGSCTSKQRRDLARLVHEPSDEAGIYLPEDWTLSAEGTLTPGAPITTLVLIMGRRASKTTLATLLEAYEIARLTQAPDPHAALLPDQEVAFLNCATSEEQATVHYRALLAHLRRLGVDPLEGSTERGLSCLLPGNLRVMSLHSNARALRGRTARFVAFDELAHFQRTGGPTSDLEVFRALAPSVQTFGSEGRVVITSSPADPEGVLWDLYCARGSQPGLLVAQFATWEFNPHITRLSLESEFMRHPDWAAAEYGAQFPSAGVQRFLPASVVRSAVSHHTRLDHDVRACTLDPSAIYFLHLDVGLVRDRTALAIAHVGAGHRSAICDGVLTWSGTREAPVSLSGLEAWLRDFARQYRVGGLSADPYESALLLERLGAAGLPVRALPFSLQRKQTLYARLEDWLRTGRLALPDEAQLIAELSHLERTVAGQGARYHAPSRGPVTTDDCADALAGVLEWLERGGEVRGPQWTEGAW